MSALLFGKSQNIKNSKTTNINAFNNGKIGSGGHIFININIALFYVLGLIHSNK